MLLRCSQRPAKGLSRMQGIPGGHGATLSGLGRLQSSPPSFFFLKLLLSICNVCIIYIYNAYISIYTSIHTHIYVYYNILYMYLYQSES